jgi:Copper transport outer membrane protein, MctB
MFDLRYHVASLAAVFLALVIGILIGVGIADQGVREAALKDDVSKLNGQLAQARDELALVERQQKPTQDFIANSYEALMANRLSGKRVAVVFFGSVDDDIRGSVDKTVGDASGHVSALRALKLPIDARGLRAALADRTLRAQYAGNDGLTDLGRDLAQELVTGGSTPLWDALGGNLVEEQDGRLRSAVDGVVVARTTPPQKPPTSRFLAGFYDGLGRSGVPAVGVENLATPGTAVPVWSKFDLSTVDDLDQPEGRLALALLLAGGETGRYGVRPKTKALLPPIEPLPAGG